MTDLVTNRARSSLSHKLREVSGINPAEADGSARIVQNGDFLMVRFDHAVMQGSKGKVRPAMVVDAGRANGYYWLDCMMVTRSFGTPWMWGFDVFELHGKTILPQKKMPPEGWDLKTGYERLLPRFVSRFPVTRKHFPNGARVVNILPKFQQEALAREHVIHAPDTSIFERFVNKTVKKQSVNGLDVG